MEHEHNARDPENLSTNEMRSGVKIGSMRYVLTWGVVIAVIGMVIGYFVYS